MRQGSLARQRRASPRHAGFSLYELMVTLAVIGVLLGAGVPTLRTTLQAARLTTAINSYLTALQLARNAAITRATPVTLCPSLDRRWCDPRAGPLRAWQGGWLVFVDADASGERDPGDELLRVFEGADGELAIQSSVHRPRVTYRATGFAPGTNLTLSFCDARGPGAARAVILSNAGRARVAPRKPDGSVPDCPTRS